MNAAVELRIHQQILTIEKNINRHISLLQH